MKNRKPIWKYNLATIFIVALCLIFCGCSIPGLIRTDNAEDEQTQLQVVGTLELQYATQFSVEYYEEDYVHIHIADGEDYVLVPEGAEDNNLGYSDATMIHQEDAANSIYLAASSAMDLFLQLDALDVIRTCSTTAEDYSMEQVKSAIDRGAITYVGKYSAPDYETLLEQDTGLAIESTMIYHAPKIQEELENLGIPVLVERSSYEETPLGRLEWIKLYGVLLGCEDQAEQYFQEQVDKVEELTATLEAQEAGQDSPSVAFFYISSNGYVNIRKPGDYLSKMITIAGGSYAFADLELDEENALSTLNINWEDFYKEAMDADILIYNGTIDGGVASMEELEEKNELFADFQAVQNGQVYCTNLNMFQETSKIADIIVDLYHVISNDAEDLQYLTKLE